MNFSHGSYEYHQSVIDNARAAEAAEPGRPIAIALDTVICFVLCSGEMDTDTI
jgi:pyruvate kinase